jgi:hypothetical protein
MRSERGLWLRGKKDGCWVWLSGKGMNGRDFEEFVEEGERGKRGWVEGGRERSCAKCLGRRRCLTFFAVVGSSLEIGGGDGLFRWVGCRLVGEPKSHVSRVDRCLDVMILLMEDWVGC